jgi:hypothetical protein
MILIGSMVLEYSDDLETGARASQTSTIPVFVPAATKRALWPGMSDGEDGWLATDMGEAYGEEAVDGVEKPSAGSSDMVRVAKVEMSKVVARIWGFLNPPKVSFELRHSSTRLSLSGELEDDMYDDLRMRCETPARSGVSEPEPPNKEVLCAG